MIQDACYRDEKAGTAWLGAGGCIMLPILSMKIAEFVDGSHGSAEISRVMFGADGTGGISQMVVEIWQPRKPRQGNCGTSGDHLMSMIQLIVDSELELA
jgi:hypothetical protein